MGDVLAASAMVCHVNPPDLFPVLIKDFQFVALRFGWLDGVAWYKKNSVKTTLCCWETVQSVHAFDQLPMRAKMQANPFLEIGIEND